MSAGGLKVLLVTFAERAFMKKPPGNGHANTKSIQCNLLDSYLSADVKKEVKGGRWESSVQNYHQSSWEGKTAHLS